MTASAAPFRIFEPVQVRARHAGLRRERHKVSFVGGKLARPRKPYFSLAKTTMERPSGVSLAREESWAASANSWSVTPVRAEPGCLPVTECDGAGL